jgi:fructooligosaccharide transport system substrate-binding protein
MTRFASRLTRRAFVAGTAATGVALATRNGRAATVRLRSLQTGQFQNETLSVWVHDGEPSENETNQAIVDAFNTAYEGQIRAELQVISNQGNDYQNQVTSAAVAGSLPDVLDVDGPFVASYAYSQIFRPLGDYFGEDVLADFVPAIVEQGTWNGQLWALGAFSGSSAILYNQEIFEDAGLTAPTAVADAWQWPRFVEVARQLNQGEVKGLDFHMDYGAGEWFTYGFSPLVWSNGGDLLSPEGTQATEHMNGAATVEAMTEVQRLFADEIVLTSPSPTQFEEGLAAMQMIGGWVIPNIEASYPDLRWSIMPLPYFDERVSPSGSWAWGITQGARNPDAAAELIRWFLDPETGVAPIVEANRLAPARLSAYPLVPFYNELPYSVYGEQNQQTARARPVTPGYPVLTARFAEAVANISLGGDVQQELDAAAQAVDEDFQRNNGYQPS